MRFSCRPAVSFNPDEWVPLVVRQVCQPRRNLRTHLTSAVSSRCRYKWMPLSCSLARCSCSNDVSLLRFKSDRWNNTACIKSSLMTILSLRSRRVGNVCNIELGYVILYVSTRSPFCKELAERATYLNSLLPFYIFYKSVYEVRTSLWWSFKCDSGGGWMIANVCRFVKDALK